MASFYSPAFFRHIFGPRNQQKWPEIGHQELTKKTDAKMMKHFHSQRIFFTLKSTSFCNETKEIGSFSSRLWLEQWPYSIKDEPGSFMRRRELICTNQPHMDNRLPRLECRRQYTEQNMAKLKAMLYHSAHSPSGIPIMPRIRWGSAKPALVSPQSDTWLSIGSTRWRVFEELHIHAACMHSGSRLLFCSS